MSFSAATCLTFNPTIQPSTGPFNIYLDSDYSSTPILTNISLWDLSNNCPYIIQNIPNGTTDLGFKDITNDYCVTIPIQNNDVCLNCNLGFSDYSSTTISKLFCGNLTGSCQTISDYKINWYGPNDTTTLAFTSGKGNIFTYQYEHPFSTLTSSIPVNNGTYTPVIDKIILSGLTFSISGETGDILFSGDCLPTTTVLPLTCNFKTNTTTSYPFSAYTNYISFNSSTQGTPTPVNTSYEISANTKFLAWAFSGSNIPDRITIEFSGTSYLNIIGIDDVIVGDLLSSNNFSASTYPKSAQTKYFFNKISCLTGLTINNNDKIIVKITPATSQTDWSLYITCLDDYNCNDCLKTQNYKIIGSTITGVTSSCDSTKIYFNISGCTSNNSDYLTYFNNVMTNNYSNYNFINTPNSIINRQSVDLYYNNYTCNLAGGYGTISTSCNLDSTPTSYNKTFLNDGTGVFGFTGSSNFISTYYNSLTNSFLGLPPYNSNWSGSTNPNDSKYYRCYVLKIPAYNSQINCGDPQLTTDLYIHHTSPIITGITGSEYYLSITAKTISNNNLFTNCQLFCNSSQNNIINNINITSTGTTINYGNYYKNFTYGVYYSNPVNNLNYLVTANTQSTYNELLGYYKTPDWVFNTYPFSGYPSTIIPSLSGSVCNYNLTGVKTTQYNSYYNTQYKYYYKVMLSNPLNVNDFDIWASPITNFSYSGAPSTTLYELAYRYSGGSVTYSNPTYII